MSSGLFVLVSSDQQATGPRGSRRHARQLQLTQPDILFSQMSVTACLAAADMGTPAESLEKGLWPERRNRSPGFWPVVVIRIFNRTPTPDVFMLRANDRPPKAGSHRVAF
jgi:hypothetical protein